MLDAGQTGLHGPSKAPHSPRDMNGNLLLQGYALPLALKGVQSVSSGWNEAARLVYTGLPYPHPYIYTFSLLPCSQHSFKEFLYVS